MSKSDEISGKLSKAASDLAFWRGLLERPGWKTLSDMLMEQVRLRHATICMTPLESFGKSLEQEFMKGEAAGISMAMAMAQTQHEMARLEVETLTVQFEEEKAYETVKRPDGGSRVDDDDFSRE